MQRQFYTLPVSTIPNNLINFSEWLYKKDHNCKYDNIDCLETSDLRYQ